MNPVKKRLKNDLQDKEFRRFYDEGFSDSSIATQIRVLREQREMTQKRLAEAAGMNQSRISELEDVNFSSWSVRSLRRLANAFDVRLKITFEEFGSLLVDVSKLDRKSLERREFSEDPAFHDTPARTGFPGTPTHWMPIPEDPETV